MELSQTSFKKDFQFISVDPPLQQQLPKWLKKVPTLVIQGEDEPRTDSEVMNWLYEKKMMTQNSKKEEVDEIDGWNSARATSP